MFAADRPIGFPQVQVLDGGGAEVWSYKTTHAASLVSPYRSYRNLGLGAYVLRVTTGSGLSGEARFEVTALERPPALRVELK